MGQQMSGEAYCQATIQKLLADLNTTDSRVGESRVTSDSGDSAAVSVDFTWREWARVSKYLERVLPGAEQKRLLNYVLLDLTGLRHCRQEISTAPVEDNYSASVETPTGPVGNGHAGDSKPGWTVHVNYGDDGSKNPILYRDFVKLHFQLDDVILPTPVVGDGDGEDATADRLADLVKRRCGSIGINLLVTKAKHHAIESCVVVSGTVDVRSVLRNAQQFELRSRLNPAKAEDHELSDQLMRSAAGLRDRIDRGASAAAAAASAPASASAENSSGAPASRSSAAAARASAAASAAAAAAKQSDGSRYFPMRLSYSEDNNRVTLVYAQEPAATAAAMPAGL